MPHIHGYEINLDFKTIQDCYQKLSHNEDHPIKNQYGITKCRKYMYRFNCPIQGCYNIERLIKLDNTYNTFYKQNNDMQLIIVYLENGSMFEMYLTDDHKTDKVSKYIYRSSTHPDGTYCNPLLDVNPPQSS